MKLFRTKMIYFINDLITTVEDGTIMSVLSLFHNEYIRSKYCDEIKNIFKKNPEKFFLNENVLFLNVNPDLELSLKNGISLTYFKKSLDNFKPNYKIHFIVALSAIDYSSYISYNKNIRDLFNNKDILKKLIAQKSLNELIKTIEEIDI